MNYHNIFSMILQVATTVPAGLGLTLGEVLTGLGILIANGLVLLKQWFSIKIKIREQDLRISQMELVIGKNECLNEKLFEKLGGILNNTRTELLDNMNDTKEKINTLNTHLEKHLGFHDGCK